MIKEPGITTMSEKGQVVIPLGLRKHLNIMPKTKFLVFGTGDTIIMKKLQLPDVRKEWGDIFATMRGKKLKLTGKDIEEEIRSHREGR